MATTDPYADLQAAYETAAHAPHPVHRDVRTSADPPMPDTKAKRRRSNTKASTTAVQPAVPSATKRGMPRLLPTSTGPAQSLIELLDRTVAQGSAELAAHAGAIRERISTAQHTPTSFLDTMVNNARSTTLVATGGEVGINDYGVKGRRQYAAERRRLLDLYVIVLNNADIRTATFHLRNEIFRRGLELIPAFDYICRSCGRTFSKEEARQTNGECSDCAYEDQDEFGRPREAHETLDTPDPDQVRRFEQLAMKCNYFNQNLESILRETQDDISTVDDAFLYFRYEYSIDEATYIAAQRDPFNPDYEPERRLKQVFRLDPTLVEFDLDSRGIPGMAHHACPFDRDLLLDVPFDEGWDVNWQGRCERCGMRTYPVYFKYSEQQAGSFGARRPEVLYLFEDEVIHWSFYSPTETYGFSPVLSFYEKALTLIGMDRYLYDYFYERRVPQGVVAVYTDDIDSMRREQANVEAKMQRDPHYVPWIAVSSKSNQGKIEYIRFGYSLDELDYLPVRDEIRERISAVYGVSNIWMSDSSGVGGLNQESQQLVVMSRAVEGAQRSYHTLVFPKLEKALRITDWHLRLNTPEESSELTEVQIRQAKATVATTMHEIGFGVEYDPDTDEFTFSGSIPSQSDQAQQQQSVAGQNPFADQ